MFNYQFLSVATGVISKLLNDTHKEHINLGSGGAFTINKKFLSFHHSSLKFSGLRAGYLDNAAKPQQIFAASTFNRNNFQVISAP